MIQVFSRIRKHFNPATAVAFLALIFAMTGGAFAMGGGGGSGSGPAGSTTGASVAKSKAKPKTKAGPRGPAGPAGKNGANGAPGPAGPAGPTGPAGGAGPTGPAGAAGEGREGKEGKSGKEGPKGEQGTTGFTETLPSGKTETGAYAVRRTNNAEEEIATTAISFTIPLASAPVESSFISLGKTPAEVEADGCKGTVTKPEALPGNLCVFEGAASLIHKGGLQPFEKGSVGTAGGGPGTTGAELVFLTQKPTTAGEEVSAEGTWAVTAE